jgi:Glycosyltransferase family 87
VENKFSAGRNSGWILVVACICSAAVWLYADRVLVAHQVADAAATDHPRGNLSDLYPRWLGARELVLRGRNPYSAEVTREVQAGYYGRVLDSTRAGDPKDQQAFAYPVYVVFILAPFVHLPFAVVQKGFFWLLITVTVAGVFLWARVVEWRPGLVGQFTAVVLTLGSLAAMQGLKLQQLSLIVVALIAAALALLTRGWLVSAGVLLALATIKPQLVAPLLLGLAIWTLGDWRNRYRCLLGFVAALAALFLASQWVLPGWFGFFLHAMAEYQRYTGAVTMLDKLLPFHLGRLVELAMAVTAIAACWRNRSAPAGSPLFGMTTALVLVVTLFVIPTYSLYNQVLLLPAILLLVRDTKKLWRAGTVNRAMMLATGAALAWPYVSASMLALASFAWPEEKVQNLWVVPFWSVFACPVGVAALMLLYAYRQSSAVAPPESQ